MAKAESRQKVPRGKQNGQIRPACMKPGLAKYFAHGA